MKKEGKFLSVFFIIGIILILSISLVSANLFSDINDFFKKIFWGKITGRAVDLSLNLLAYYSFDGNANDISGNGNDGVVNGATLASGKIEQAYSFDGINDYIEVPKEKLNINGALEI